MGWAPAWDPQRPRIPCPAAHPASTRKSKPGASASRTPLPPWVSCPRTPSPGPALRRKRLLRPRSHRVRVASLRSLRPARPAREERGSGASLPPLPCTHVLHSAPSRHFPKPEAKVRASRPLHLRRAPRTQENCHLLGLSGPHFRHTPSTPAPPPAGPEPRLLSPEPRLLSPDWPRRRGVSRSETSSVGRFGWSYLPVPAISAEVGCWPETWALKVVFQIQEFNYFRLPLASFKNINFSSSSLDFVCRHSSMHK